MWEKTKCGAFAGIWISGACEDHKKVRKLEDRSNVMFFISYESGTKAYRYLDPSNFKVSISTDLIFEESQCWDFSQQGGQRVDFTFTSVIDLENSSEFSTINQNSNPTSYLPSYENIDQGQLSDEEERLERLKSIQSVYEET